MNKFCYTVSESLCSQCVTERDHYYVPLSQSGRFGGGEHEMLLSQFMQAAITLSLIEMMPDLFM
jgi:hypothetical protein